jgi:hypothetical protein
MPRSTGGRAIGPAFGEGTAESAPPALMRKMNPLVRRVLSSRRMARRINAMTILQFEGRRSGRLIRVPVALHIINAAPVAFTHRSWRLNFTGGIPVAVTPRGQVRQGRGALLAASPEQVAIALRQALDNGTSPFVLGLKVARSHVPTIACRPRPGRDT